MSKYEPYPTGAKLDRKDAQEFRSICEATGRSRSQGFRLAIKLFNKAFRHLVKESNQ